MMLKVRLLEAPKPMRPACPRTPTPFLPLEWGRGRGGDTGAAAPTTTECLAWGVMVLSQCQVLKPGLALSSSHSCLLSGPPRGRLKNARPVSSTVPSSLSLCLCHPREEVGGCLPSPTPTSHNGTAFGLFLLEGRRDEFGTTGEVKQSLGEAADRALWGHRAGLVQTHHGRRPEDAVDTLF